MKDEEDIARALSRLRVFAVRAWSCLSAALLLLGTAGLADDVRVWSGWLRALRLERALSMDPALAGILAGAGGMGLFVFTVARWGESAWRTMRALRGVWRYIRATASGKVTIRYGDYMIEGDYWQGTSWSSKRLPKGKVDHIQFTAPPTREHGLVIELPAVYKLVFGPGPIRWKETVRDGRRRYRAPMTGVS